MHTNTLPLTGSCTLVGAGPGDPELLTLKALKAIQRATVLLVDDLVNEAIVAHAAPTARIVHVGKRGGCTSTPQSFIEKLMITAVREGEHVVRLKGGDVVNGITSGLAAVTSLGVPLTHREHAQGVIFLTGHAKPGASGPDWAAIATTAHAARLTLVIYMGVSGALQIEQGLLSGLPGETPVALVQHASLPTQRHALTTLDQLHATLVREALGSPCVMVVGDVLQGVWQLAQQPAQAGPRFALGL